MAELCAVQSPGGESCAQGYQESPDSQELIRSVSLSSYGFPNFRTGKAGLTLGNRNRTASNTRIFGLWNMALLSPHSLSPLLAVRAGSVCALSVLLIPGHLW